ncbi:hypothetical protein [Lentisalinibacter salinarum]|uniref:hypothetical protein n=1 Tax=Lentisalinibacter salinarum TaxID=2992239 RepID=UPI0038695AD2
MASSRTYNTSASARTVLRLLAFAVLVLAAAPSWAVDCSEFPNGTIDGFAGDVAPAQIQIDRNCTIRNFPASNPLDTNFSFLTQPGQTDERWLIVFDNVVHTGEMACNSVAGHRIWFVNGSSSSIQEGCQNLLIPVEKIEKDNPPGTTTASIGVPFTYALTMPVLFDAGTGTVIDEFGSLNDLHGVTLIDDLNATGVDLTYVSHTAYWESTGLPVAHTFDNDGGVLTFDNFPIIPSNEQIVIELTVVLEDSPANAIGTQFVNTAKWDFGRLIDGIFYEPLPGEWGISDPLTIAGPDIVVTKTGPATLGRTLNLGQWGEFAIDVHNTGLGEAWDVALVDRLPDGPQGGMCDIQPEILDAQVYAADGVTPVSGKGPLTPGVDFDLVWQGSPRCELTLDMLTPAAMIGPDEHLIIRYRSRLDADTDDGVQLTNVAGATRWYNGAAGNPDRLEFARPVTNGTVGTADHQDAHTVTTALYGYFFEKTVANVTSGADPAESAAPGDRLRYTLRLQTTDGPLEDVAIRDDLGSLNAAPVFVPGSLQVLPGSLPPGATTAATDPFGGTNGTGQLVVTNIDLPADGELVVEFEVTLAEAILDGTVVANQSELIGAVKLADSDDPTVNGQADPDVPGDEDPTTVVIEAEPPPALAKAATQPTAAIGEAFSYRLTVPTTPHSAPLYDVRIVDDLTASAADLEFVSVARVSGPAGWTPQNTGTATSLVIEDPANGIDIPAGEQVVVEITVALSDTPTNVAGLEFTNTAAYTYNQLDGQGATERPGDGAVSGPMTIVEPELTLEKYGPLRLRAGETGVFTLDVHNVGTSTAWNVYLTDLLPDTADGGLCDAAPAQVTAQLFEADGTTAVAAPLTAGADYAVSFSGRPGCTFTLEVLSPAGGIAPDQRLLVTYEAGLDADTVADAAFTNIAGATEWSSVDVSTPDDRARTYSRTITDGTVDVLDHEDAHTVVEFSPELLFEKTVVNVTTGEDPAAVATPGDTLRYSLYVENLGDTPVDEFRLVDELDRLNDVPAFQPGTLTVVTLPAGAVAANTDAAGGAAGTGLLDVGGLSLGGVGDTVRVEFEVTLASVIRDGTYVTNQSELLYQGNAVAVSDDPLVNGAADPNVTGDEDPTRVLIESAPYFTVEKVSSYVSGDPDVLLAGETLRYTITVRNTGTDDARDAVIADAVPANTTYVAGSTTLNGVGVADADGGVSPLADGIPINAPDDATPGLLPAAAAPDADDTATIVFDVVVDPDAADGTVISNQAFVSAPDGGVIDRPSDDPRTPVADDPTRDVVGRLPLLYAEKSAALQDDLGTPGIVDPGDTLRYTITVYNNGTVPATVVELVDQVPEWTTYVADTTTLNGLAAGQPDGGNFPLAAGLPLSSADLTPPLPGAGEGTLSPGASATVQFYLLVNADAVPGTLIENQATVSSYELPDLLTDGDGDPATGPEPTVVVVGDAQQLAISKQVTVVGGGVAEAGSTLEYLVTVRNIASVPAYDVVIYDDLDLPEPAQLIYVDGSAAMNGSDEGVAFAGTLLTADYGSLYGALQPDETVELRFRAVIEPTLPIGTTVTNIAEVRWNQATQSATASVSVDVGGTPGSAAVNGTVWHDADFDDVDGAGERRLEGWSVEVWRNDTRVRSVLTDADGNYRVSGLVPNYLTDDVYEIRFVAPGAGPRSAALGLAYSADFTNYPQRIAGIELVKGNNLQDLNLPIDPAGVVYNSVSRAPVAGAVVTLLDGPGGTPVPAACFEDPVQQNQVTLSDGWYKFDLNFGDPGCPDGADYVISVTPPGAGYVPGPSEIIPASNDATGAAFDVPSCPGSTDDAVPGTSEHCEVQASETAPPASVRARTAGTTWYERLTLDGTSVPGSSQLFNNHIPVDPELSGAVSVTKSTPMVNVNRGQLVPYLITVNNTIEIELTDVNVVDRYPAGFAYVAGSARIDGVAVEPVMNGRELVWENLILDASGRHEIHLLLAVGAGVSEGEFVNRAQVMNGITGNAMSGEATATVRLVPDPTFDCTDVTGKVFDDRNRNGFQDEQETGLAGVRLVTPRGLAATTDAHGRFHITCAVTPNETRGSNFVLKLDDRTLPSGYRPSTRSVQIKRATRGKALDFDFGASIHRVVGLDLADAAFEADSVELRSLWQPRLELLMDELRKAPSVLRLSYLADVESPRLVERRLEAIRRRILEDWAALDCCYELAVEPEVHWRLGSPPERPRSRGEERP